MPSAKTDKRAPKTKSAAAAWKKLARKVTERWHGGTAVKEVATQRQK